MNDNDTPAIETWEHEERLNEIYSMLKKPVPDFSKMTASEIEKLRYEEEEKLAHA